MRLGTISVIGQILIVACLIGIGTLSIVLMRETQGETRRVVESAASLAPAAKSEIAAGLDEIERATRSGMGLIAITAAGALFFVLLLGHSFAQNVIVPLGALAREASEVAQGRRFRRSPESRGPSAIRATAAAVNRLTDRLEELEHSRAGELLLARASLEKILGRSRAPACVAEPTGRPVATNELFRTRFRDAESDWRACFARAISGAEHGAEVAPITAGGRLRGYLIELGS